MGAINNQIVEEIDMEATQPVDKVLEFVGTLTTTKLAHGRLVMEGVCLKCAHCGQKLTDSVSIERGIGPVCSKKGYMEDPKDGDEMGAMIALSEFPNVCQFLVANYRKDGLRSLMNGIVKIASLNRGNHELHVACCDAVDALGYIQLSNTLRESVSVVELKEVDDGRSYEVYVKRYAFTWAWFNDLRGLSGFTFVKYPKKHCLLKVKHVDGTPETVVLNGERVTAKRALAILMAKHFKGLCGRVVGKSGFKIDEAWLSGHAS
jgi:hypothetical protein